MKKVIVTLVREKFNLVPETRKDVYLIMRVLKSAWGIKKFKKMAKFFSEL